MYFRQPKQCTDSVLKDTKDYLRNQKKKEMSDSNSGNQSSKTAASNTLPKNGGYVEHYANEGRKVKANLET